MKLWAKSCKSDKIIDLLSEIFHFTSVVEPKLVGNKFTMLQKLSTFEVKA